MRPQELVERALAASRGDRAVVVVRESSTANLRWAGNTLTTNGDMRSRHVTVVSVRDGADGSRVGVVTRSVADADDLDRLVAQADAESGRSDLAPDAQELSPAAVSADWDDASPATSAATFAGFAPQLGEAFGQAEAAGHELFGFAEHDLVTTYLGTSGGSRLRHVQPNGKVELTGKAAQRTRSAWSGRYVPDFGAADVAGQTREVAQQLAWQQRQVEVAPGHHEVVLSPSAVADLMVYLYWSAGARDAAEGRTVFSRPGGGTRVGDQLTQLPVRLWSDPSDAQLTACPFVVAEASTDVTSVFDNGVPLTTTDWIADGRLRSLLQTRHSASLTALPLTPYVDNLSLAVAGGAGSLSEVVAGVDRGLLVNTLWYIRVVDPQTLLLTGLTRDGVYRVEGGEVVGATSNFRFNDSPVDLLRRVTGSGTTVGTLPREWSDDFTRAAMPALRVEGFNMSTHSPAS